MSKISVMCVEKSIWQISIDDLENKNRLNNELVIEFMAALTSLATDSTLKVLIISGHKDVFCAGATLETLKQISTGSTHVKELLLPHKMLSFPLPIIGALEGHAVGGGLMLALYCDVLVSAENSRYGVNFTNMGFTPGMGTTSLLPAIVGHHFASEMILTGKLYKGRELKERGIFNYVIPKQEVMNLALDIGRRMAEKPRHVLEMLKDILSLPRRQALQNAVSNEHLMHKICFNCLDTAAIEETYPV